MAGGFPRLQPVMAVVRPDAPGRVPRAIPDPDSHGFRPWGGYTNDVRVLAALGSPPVDLRTPELLLEIAGSHSGFVLQILSVLLMPGWGGEKGERGRIEGGWLMRRV